MKMSMGWRTRPKELMSHYYKEKQGWRVAISLCGKVYSNKGDLIRPDPDRDGGESCGACLQKLKNALDSNLKTWLGV